MNRHEQKEQLRQERIERERRAQEEYRRAAEEPEVVVETDIVLSGDVGNELVPRPDDELRGARSEADLERAVRDHIVNDFEQALNLIVRYQKILYTLYSPDPAFEEARKLLHKYGFVAREPRTNFKVYDPEHGDITTYTDSVPGTAAEVHTDELPDSDENFRYALTESGPLEEPEPCDYCKQKEREWSPGCEENKKLGRNEDHDEVPEELVRGLRKRFAEELVDQGYEPCPICDGSGTAKKGVLKGKTCNRCGGEGLWKPPEVAELVADEDGNVRLRPPERTVPIDYDEEIDGPVHPEDPHQ